MEQKQKLYLPTRRIEWMIMIVCSCCCCCADGVCECCVMKKRRKGEDAKKYYGVEKQSQSSVVSQNRSYRYSSLITKKQLGLRHSTGGSVLFQIQSLLYVVQYVAQMRKDTNVVLGRLPKKWHVTMTEENKKCPCRCCHRKERVLGEQSKSSSRISFASSL